METTDVGADQFEFARRLHVAIWVFDIDNLCVAYANKSACALWCAETEEELRARDMGKDMSATVRKRLRQYQLDFSSTDAEFNEMWTLYPNQLPKNVMVVFSGFVLPDGRMAMLCEAVGAAEDTPENLRSAEALLHTDVMIVLFSHDGPPLYMNPAARNAFDPKMRSFAELFVDAREYTKMVEQVKNAGECRLVAEVRTGSDYCWHDLSAILCTDAATGKPAILVTAIDVSELKYARDKARYLANWDQLTGCYNRTYLQNLFDELRQKQNQKPSAIVFFDVDHFKQINDRYGHETGDAVLMEIVTRIQSMIRNNDLIGRLGGDEFIVYLDGACDENDVMKKVEMFRAALNEPIFHAATRIRATVSMGVVLVADGRFDFTSALHDADIALYASKQAGRNKATVFNEEMGRAAKARNAFEDSLKKAIQNQQFVLEYQPRTDVLTGVGVAVEGLVRWNHPTRGMIPPGEFIPICEETGMIEDLGRLVLEMGCRQAIAWQEMGLDVVVSINLSPRQFEDSRFLGHLAELANAPGFPKGRIELEITESVLIGDHLKIIELLKLITQMGFRIAIDDFGTGYSNLSYISQFPLDCIKIDRSFIMQLPDTGPIVSLILTLAQQIGATVVAEGVEYQEQMDWLRENACEQVQGFLLARPMDVAAVTQHLVGGVGQTLCLPGSIT